MIHIGSAIDQGIRTPSSKWSDSISPKVGVGSKRPLLPVKSKSSRVDLKRIYKTKEFFDEVAVDNGSLSPEERKRKLEEHKMIS